MLPKAELVRRGLDAVRGGALAVFVFDDEAGAKPAVTALPADLRPAVQAELVRRRFRGARGEVAAIPTGEGRGRRTVFVGGLGSRAALDAETLRLAAAAVVRAAQREREESLTAALPDGGERLAPEAVALGVGEGLAVGQYRFERFVTDKERHAPRVAKLAIASVGASAGKTVARALERAAAYADAAALVRDLVNLPPADLYPEVFADEARRAVRGTPVKFKVLGERELEREKMGALLGVARGSDRAPRLVHLSYKPQGRARARLAFVGKGVTFDSGGYNIKPTDGMDTMKCDMAGAAAVLGATLVLARLGAPVEVHGIMGLVENLVSGRAYKPGDVLVSRSGRTIEVNNTDAEGRLVLADALDYAGRLAPQAIVDVATLTGACVVALGPNCSGLLSSDDALAAALLEAARRAGEKVWRLPLIEEYRDQMKSDIADTKNTGNRWGGTITAALFLQSFVPKGVPWAHLDIAGPAFLNAEHAFWGKGGTAAALGTLVEYALAR